MSHPLVIAAVAGVIIALAFGGVPILFLAIGLFIAAWLVQRTAS